MYIGYTNTGFEYRIQEHLKCLKRIKNGNYKGSNYNSDFVDDFKKHGISAFKFFILYESKKDDSLKFLQEKERYYIKKYNSNIYGYNCYIMANNERIYARYNIYGEYIDVTKSCPTGKIKMNANRNSDCIGVCYTREFEYFISYNPRNVNNIPKKIKVANNPSKLKILIVDENFKIVFSSFIRTEIRDYIKRNTAIKNMTTKDCNSRMFSMSFIDKKYYITRESEYEKLIMAKSKA